MDRINKRKLRKYIKENELEEKIIREEYRKRKQWTTIFDKAEIDGKEVLVIFMYYSENEKPTYITFLSEEDYTTWDDTGKWKEASLQNLMNRFYSESNSPDKEGNRKAEEFLKEHQIKTNHYDWKNPGENKIERKIRNMQGDIREKRLEERDRKETEPIDRAMEKVKEIPENFEQFCREHTPHYAYYKYERKGKNKKAVCSCCGKKFPVQEPKHMKHDTCKKCGRNVILKSYRKAPVSQWNETDVEMIQKYEDGIILRYFRVRQMVHKELVMSGRNGVSVSIEEVRRDIYKDEQLKQVYRYEYGLYKNRNTRWKYLENMSRTPALIYTDNLKEELKGTAWEHCQIEQMEGIEFRTMNYIERYIENRWFEYAAKKGLTRILQDAASISYGYEKEFNVNGKTLNEVLKVEKQDMQMLVDTNAGINELKYIRDKRKKNEKIQKSAISKVGQLADIIGYENLKSAMKYVKEVKFANYITKNQTLAETTIHERMRIWNDYIRLALKLGYDMQNSMVLYPRNLKQEHDAAVELFNEKQNEAERKRLNKVYRKIKKMEKELQEKYAFEDKDMFIRAPHDAGEIVHEGQVLHHCVGGYVEKVAEGKTTILFMRKKAEPEKPYYTIEVKDGKVKQWYGEYNNARKPKTEKEKKFIKKFTKERLENGTVSNERV